MREIVERLLSINEFSRPGWKLKKVSGIVYHWVGSAGQENEVTARYFELLAEQDSSDNKPDRYASAHFIIGIDGEIMQVIPTDEVAYHVGGKWYTDKAHRSFPGYTTNARMEDVNDFWTPNWCTIGIEMCHPNTTGKFTNQTLHAAKWLGNYLLKRNFIGYDQIFRHYDITGKNCPKWFVEHEMDWKRFILNMKSIRMLRQRGGHDREV